jgi:thioester reductase-like protein
MAIFITGSTGYLGAHVAANLLERYADALNLLVRAKDSREAEGRLWRAVRRVDFYLDGPVDVMVDGEVLTLHCQTNEVLPAALNVMG